MSEMPRYNPTPDAYQPPSAPVAPPIMNTIFFMLIGAAVLSVISAIFAVVNAGSDTVRAQVESQLAAQKVEGITPDMIDTLVAFSVATVIGIAAVGVIAYVLVALFIKKGMGWARIVGLVLAVLSLSQLLGLAMPGGIATILQILLGIAAMYLCFTGPGAAYFKAKKEFKLASKGH